VLNKYFYKKKYENIIKNYKQKKYYKNDAMQEQAEADRDGV